MAQRRTRQRVLARSIAGVLAGAVTGVIAGPSTAALADDSPAPVDTASESTIAPAPTDAAAGTDGTADTALTDPLSGPPPISDPTGSLPAIDGPTPTSVPGMIPAIPEVTPPVALSARERLRLRVQLIRTSLVALAKAQVGDRYSRGSSGPDRFDCSGLTLYLYDKAAGEQLPHYSRAQYQMAKKLPLSAAKPGDLVFYLRGGAHHVGLYIGRGLMVHAVGIGKGVRIGSIKGAWYSRTFTGIGRVLPDA